MPVMLLLLLSLSLAITNESVTFLRIGTGGVPSFKAKELGALPALFLWRRRHFAKVKDAILVRLSFLGRPLGIFSVGVWSENRR